jgi:hypothetical protein
MYEYATCHVEYAKVCQKSGARVHDAQAGK